MGNGSNDYKNNSAQNSFKSSFIATFPHCRIEIYISMPNKNFQDYIIENENGLATLSDYAISPAVAFLKYVCWAKDAAKMTLNKFRSNKRNKRLYTKDAEDSIHIINAGLLAAIMGNFETFQKYLFASMFDYSIYLNNFNVESFIKKCKKATKASDGTTFEMDFARFSAYRDTPVAVGIILSNQLKNWQAPTIVNDYFKAFALKDSQGRALEIYSNTTKEQLSVLWQMRHSIVHTASTITIPDSQKIPSLRAFGGKMITLDFQFISEVARKMHPIIKDATNHMSEVFKNNLKAETSTEVRQKIDKLFLVKSSCSVWLR